MYNCNIQRSVDLRTFSSSYLNGCDPSIFQIQVVSPSSISCDLFHSVYMLDIMLFTNICSNFFFSEEMASSKISSFLRYKASAPQSSINRTFLFTLATRKSFVQEMKSTTKNFQQWTCYIQFWPYTREKISINSIE